MPACSILVVEDDTSIREILVMVLKEENLTVTSARNGIDALSIIDSEPIDLVVLDLVLPDVSGPSMVQQIRTTCPNMRILATSASPPALAVAVAHGVDAVLAKPFELDELLAIVTRLCPAEAKPGPFGLSPSPA